MLPAATKSHDLTSSSWRLVQSAGGGAGTDRCVPCPQPTRLEQATQLPSFYAEDSVAAANETWARLHADPLFAMKQQELAARKRVVKNPVLMAAVRQEVSALLGQLRKIGYNSCHMVAREQGGVTGSMVLFAGTLRIGLQHEGTL